eukprot:scaffold368_cov258-Pinguiococcus_pyrenoidosus.AAC.56
MAKAASAAANAFTAELDAHISGLRDGQLPSEDHVRQLCTKVRAGARRVRVGGASCGGGAVQHWG